MTTTVTVSEFRDNLAKYLDLLKAGHFVELTDGRRGTKVVILKKDDEDDFDWEKHDKFMKNFKPFFTDKDVKKIKELRRRTRNRLKRLNW